MNKVLISGNLGKDPELAYTQQGTAKCKFSVAVNEKWKDQSGESKERTEWFNVMVWGKLAELCGKYLSKGRKVLIEGRLQTRSYTDKAGEEKWITEVIAKEVEFLGGGNGDSDSGRRSTQNESRKVSPPQNNFDSSDDIPF